MMKESVLLGVTPLPWIRLRSNCVVNISVKEDGDIDANVMSRDTCSRVSQNGSSAAAVTYTSCELIFCPISFSKSFKYSVCIFDHSKRRVCIFSRQASLARQAFLKTALHGSRSKTGKNVYAKK